MAPESPVDGSTRETLTELGNRARAVVEELARHARARRDDAGAGAAPPQRPAEQRMTADGSPLAQLHRRLDELRACVAEVIDVLGATAERLETVELQLGDPDAGGARRLVEGIERCERVLMGIEHRVAMAMERRVRTAGERGARPREGAEALTVLVVTASSSRRAHLCLALERQGLATLAAADVAMAVKMAARLAPSVALVALDGPRERRAAWMEEWKECEDRGTLPRAAVLDAGGGDAWSAFGLATIKEDHGEAAMAASLVCLAHAGREGATAE